MSTILDIISAHAAARPDAIVARTYSKRGKPGARTRAEIWASAARAASRWAELGVQKGDVVILIGTHHLDLYPAWLGAVWLGAVPSILAEPSVRMAPEIYWSRFDALLARIEPKAVGCDPRWIAPMEGRARIISYEALATDGAPPPPPRVTPSRDDLLLLQHSSGTTGLQKGVMLTHGAVQEHAASYARTLEVRPDDVVATWLPLYHDMGMIACFVCPLLWGVEVVWLSPFEWVVNPRSILDAAAEHAATLLWLPNFAHAFLASRVSELKPGASLAKVRAIVNCSEPVTAPAIDQLTQRFAPFGLEEKAAQACYAMAENVFAVTSTAPGVPPKRWKIDRATWTNEHRAVEAQGGALELVSSGRAIDRVELRVTDERGGAVPTGTAGRIFIRSPFLFSGYYLAPDPSPFDAQGYFDTGDLGVVDADGELYVTGRRKDLVIVGGKNIYPQDIEDVASGVTGVHPGRVVCFGVDVPSLGTEGLIVLAEPAEDVAEADWASISERIRRAIPERLDLDLIDARVVARGALRKSSSGKFARAGNREWYIGGRFGPPPEAVAPTEKS